MIGMVFSGWYLNSCLDSAGSLKYLTAETQRHREKQIISFLFFQLFLPKKQKEFKLRVFAPPRFKGLKMNENKITEQIIGAAIEVHRVFGPGLLESVYEDSLVIELRIRKLKFERQKAIPLKYKRHKIMSDLKLDLMVEDKVIAELKTVERLLPVHEAQLLTYLKLTGCKVGLLINFNVPVLKDGIKRMVNKY